MTAVLADETAQLHALVIVILGAASTVTLVLGAVGLYGALAYVVTLRRRELGIRLALGASPQRVAATVARYGLTLALAGRLAAGLALFALIARFVRVWLFDVAVSDPAALGARRSRSWRSPCWPAGRRRGARHGSIRSRRCGPSNGEGCRVDPRTVARSAYMIHYLAADSVPQFSRSTAMNRAIVTLLGFV